MGHLRAGCAVTSLLLVLWASWVSEQPSWGPLPGKGAFISWVGWGCTHHWAELPGMVSLGPVQNTFFTGSPLMVNSSLQVPSAWVGFTYTKGSWWMVTICKVKHRHLLASAPSRAVLPWLGRCRAMQAWPKCPGALLSWHLGVKPLSPAVGPGFGSFLCT